MDFKWCGNLSPDGDASVVSTNWTSWIENFEAFADFNNIPEGKGNANMMAQGKA